VVIEIVEELVHTFAVTMANINSLVNHITKAAATIKSLRMFY
jgi:hypothetical protein